ncbi:hypothetical protein [Streptomyces griseus]|uniref:hypothetical protein n=1 Tax=Streptomyces griseus TaxID=1911 RepID=UPI0005615044|nr:hypothetical protein [Streptomyces griseus]
MPYLILGLIGLLAGIRVLMLRRRRLSAAASSSPLILRPAFLAVLAAIAIAGGAFLVAGGVATLVQG